MCWLAQFPKRKGEKKSQNLFYDGAIDGFFLRPGSIFRRCQKLQRFAMRKKKQDTQNFVLISRFQLWGEGRCEKKQFWHEGLFLPCFFKGGVASNHLSLSLFLSLSLSSLSLCRLVVQSNWDTWYRWRRDCSRPQISEFFLALR